jgi:signal transduction histidine kinase
LKDKTKELADANIQLKDLNSSKDKLFSIIAHDLKNPFSVILGYSKLLATQFQTFTEENRIKYVDRIFQSTKAVYNLLDNLLNWADTQINSLNLNREKVDLQQTIHDTIILLNENSAKKDLEITSNLSESLYVYADANMLSSVIQNLLTNAIKFTPHGGKIDIHLSKTNKKVQVSIADSGIGMSEELVGNIFKIDKSTSRKGTNGERGTGLGLILCKEFITKNKGDIWVESKPEQGSTFYFTLPLNKKEPDKH